MTVTIENVGIVDCEIHTEHNRTMQIT